VTEYIGFCFKKSSTFFLFSLGHFTVQRKCNISFSHNGHMCLFQTLTNSRRTHQWQRRIPICSDCVLLFDWVTGWLGPMSI